MRFVPESRQCARNKAYLYVSRSNSKLSSVASGAAAAQMACIFSRFGDQVPPPAPHSIQHAKTPIYDPLSGCS